MKGISNSSKAAQALCLLVVLGATRAFGGSGQLSSELIRTRAGKRDRSERDLFMAASSGDVGMVRAFLRRGADPNFFYRRSCYYPEGMGRPDKIGRSVLEAVLQSGRMDVAQELLRGGAEVDHRNPHAGLAQTVLARAAQRGELSLIDGLIRLGADVNLPSVSGGEFPTTPLFFAAKGGHLPAVQLLLRKGARTPNDAEITKLVSSGDATALSAANRILAEAARLQQERAELIEEALYARERQYIPRDIARMASEFARTVPGEPIYSSFE